MKFLIFVVLLITYSLCSETSEEVKVEQQTDFEFEENADPNTSPIYLTEQQYTDTFINSKPDRPWIIMFYKYKCPFCKVVKPELDQLAFMSDGKFRVAMVNGYKEELLKETFDVTGYPSIFLIKDNKVQKYTGKRTADNFLEFVNRN